MVALAVTLNTVVPVPTGSAILRTTAYPSFKFVSSTPIPDGYFRYSPPIKNPTFPTSLATNTPEPSGGLRLSTTYPAGGFRDFSHFGVLSVDPAKFLLLATSNAGVGDVAWNRYSVSALFPRKRTASGSTVLWNDASYLGMGVKFKAVGAGRANFICASQVEATTLVGATATPYDSARGLHARVQPTRLNWFPDPWYLSTLTGFAYGAQGTLSQANEVLTVTATTMPGGGAWGLNRVIFVLPGSQEWTTSISYTASGQGVTAYLNVQPSLKGVPVGPPVIVTGVGTGRLSVTTGGLCDALTVRQGISGAVGTVTWTDPLVEQTYYDKGYFDGSMGTDYQWQQGKSPGAGASFYYQDYISRSYLVQAILNENCPLGVLPAAPDYGILPTQ